MSHNNYYLHALIKDLTPLEVFDYYDGPRFYSCRDKLGQLFIVYWIGESEHESEWLYIRLSEDRYAALKKGSLGIAKALSEPEEDFAFIVKNTGINFTVEEITANAIDPSWLPESDDVLNIETSTLPEKKLSALESALATNRQVLDIAFEKLTNAYEMECGKLGKLLDSIQNTIYALACSTNKEIKKIPEIIKFNNEAFCTATFRSSFGIRLQSRGGDLFLDSGESRALESLTDLISSIENPEITTQKLKNLNVLTIARFKNLLDMLVESKVGLKADWASPHGQNLSTHVSYDQILRTLNKLQETDKATTKTVVLSGRLVGISLKSNFFALEVEGSELYKGSLAEHLLGQHFEVPSIISATILESCVINPLTDKEKWTYIMLEFTVLSD